ncbi:universal stress protein [Christiangramia forsetii]|uniref:Universal stress protein family protein n=2 Tax=Christiangramia forsetii TaxID=411153 RepID=A0M196_CHRFK|nr:universal stress protein [Christiangramia forsetii]GGG43052.1 universal stress protein UspA [Christiangramia forsetii]CAL66391.1 universal stress protein family protein [Christiangramia forsetii KT0803]
MKTILVPVDFSEYSEYALEVAASIAKKQNAEIIVLHMMGLSESFLTKDEKQEVFNAIYYMKLTRKGFQKLLDKDYLNGLDIQEVVTTNKVFAEVNELASEYKADLIVMGSQGSTGMKEVFIGSNTEKVVRTSDIPVLVIKERTSNFNIENAVFVTDFEPDTLNSFIRVRKFFKVFNVEPKILFINIPEKFMSSSEMNLKAHNFLIDVGVDNKEIKDEIIFYDDYTAEKGIFNYCNELKIDAIAIPTHGRQGLSHFFYGSVGEDVANHANIPVITFKI